MVVTKLGLVLLSGGLDSTTVAAMAVHDGYDLSAVTVHYGQAHVREIDSARRVAETLGIRHRVVDITFFRELAWYSALTQPDQFDLPVVRSPEQMAADIPITYVPLRNTLFVTLGAAFLESQALDAIERQGVDPANLEATLFVAANSLDYSGYPDCRPAYYQSVANTVRLGSKLGTQYDVSIEIATPLIAMSKAEIALAAVRANAPLEYTWSCYAGGDHPCAECDSCMLRAKGFAEAGLADPALVRG